MGYLLLDTCISILLQLLSQQQRNGISLVFISGQNNESVVQICLAIKKNKISGKWVYLEITIFNKGTWIQKNRWSILSTHMNSLALIFMYVCIHGCEYEDRSQNQKRDYDRKRDFRGGERG